MLDELDRAVVHALHLDGRVPFARIGEVLGVSTQTVTRRFHRLQAEAGLRVVGLPAPERVGWAQWMVRLTAAPATAGHLARSLARRRDTSWVRLTSGGTEIVAIVTAPTDDAGSPSLLLHDIPRTRSVTAVSAHCILHVYRGGPSAWPGRISALTEEQQRELRPPEATVDDGRAGSPPAAAEWRLFDVLGRDGRAGYRELAAATGWSEATVARRLRELREHGTLFFDVDIDDSQLGIGTRAMLWMAVPPGELDHVATALADHPELAFVVATTGPSNLIAQALCPDPAALHRYLTRRLGALPAIRALETAPVLHTIKTASGHPAGIDGEIPRST